MKKKAKDWTKNQPILLVIQWPLPQENQIEVNAVMELCNAVGRAIRHDKTTLNDEELGAFLRQSKGSTCMQIKINTRELTRCNDRLSNSICCSDEIRYYIAAVLPLDVASPYTEEILKSISNVCRNWWTPIV